MLVNEDFRPPFWLRPPLIQSVLASAKFRVKGETEMEKAAQHITLDCGNGIRTTAMLSRHPQERGLVVLLHGWLGSPESTYVVATARTLFAQGYSVCRLTLLEHGDTLTLNPVFLHAARHGELVNAVAQIFAMEHKGPGALIGYSLGGNFALRVARETKTRAISGLDHAFAISPVITPVKASKLMDESRFVQGYFRRKLHRWAHAKQAAFPDLFEMQDLLQEKTIMGISEICIDRWTDFGGLDAYFDAYRIGPDDLTGCPVRVTAITALDDPVVPGDELSGLARDANLETLIYRHGGHNGFFRRVSDGALYDALITERIAAL